MDSNKALYGLSEIVLIPAAVLLVTALFSGLLVLLGWMEPGKALLVTSGLFVAGLVLTQLFRMTTEIRALQQHSKHSIATTTAAGSKERKQISALLDQGKDLQAAVTLLGQRIGELESLAARNQPESVTQKDPATTSATRPELFLGATAMPLPVLKPPAEAAVTGFGRPADVKRPAPAPAPPPADRSLSLNRSSGLDEKLTLHLQPVVSLADGEPRFFDALMRLQQKDGVHVEDAEFERIAETGKMLPAIEKKVVFSSARAIGMLNSAGQRQELITRLSFDTLNNGSVFGDIVGFLAAQGYLQNSLMFTISQRDLKRLSKEERGRLTILSNMGFHLVVDKVLDLDVDARVLSDSGFTHVKIPAAMIIHAALGSHGRLTPAALIERLNAAGLALIATEVERDEDRDQLIALNVELAQGKLLGKPRALKPEFVDTIGRVA